jgi:pyridinium-3,5-biscarboxylic acid mononucleotide sulfurtransferase
VNDDLDRLKRVIAGTESAVVAFSGGVDSSVVAAAAQQALGTRAIAVTAVSPALATGELDGARAVAAHIGIEHRALGTDELARPGYRANGPDRCYHCKSELYDRLTLLARGLGFDTLFSGANVDDLGDWRPGLRAAQEHAVRHPLVEAELGKTQIRAIARGLGLPSAEKPAMPCLASRLPFGTPVDPLALAQIDRAERALKALGIRDLRVRHLGERARVELAEGEAEQTTPEAIIAAVRVAGYGDVEIDSEPLRSGSLHGLRAPLPMVTVSGERDEPMTWASARTASDRDDDLAAAVPRTELPDRRRRVAEGEPGADGRLHLLEFDQSSEGVEVNRVRSRKVVGHLLPDEE